MANKVSAGAYDLNKFLFGGYERDIITTIYGPGGSGKSNFCMIVAVSQAKKGRKVIFIDTEGSFSIDRFKQVHGGTKEQIENDLQNILILNPTSFKEQEEALEKLLIHIKKQEISLIIVDSLTMLYRLELGEAISNDNKDQISRINRKLANQLRTLNEIARKQHIAVLVTNQVYSSFDAEIPGVERKVNMVGGDLLKYWSKCIIELTHFRGKRKLTLKKHRSLPEKDLYFEIQNSGIKKKGIF